MIKITIEIWPSGFQSHSRTLGSVEISNDGTGTKSIGNYNIKFKSKNGKILKRKRVEGHRRKATSVWKLLEKVFSSWST